MALTQVPSIETLPFCSVSTAMRALSWQAVKTLQNATSCTRVAGLAEELFVEALIAL